MPNKFPRLEARDTFAAAGASTFASTVAVTGALTATGGVVGAVTGNVVGNVTGDLTPAVEAAAHGAGAIGDGAAPRTYRWIENGVIITRVKIDLSGLAASATANDVVGLATGGGVAYIGQNVVATNGVIFKVEFSCIETPVGGDLDVNVVANASDELAYDGAGGEAYLSNSGTLTIGQTIQLLTPALTANHYYYVTGGTTTTGTYTAGQYILTTYGHPVLT